MFIATVSYHSSRNFMPPVRKAAQPAGPDSGLISQLIWCRVDNHHNHSMDDSLGNEPLFSPESQVYQTVKRSSQIDHHSDLENTFSPLILPIHELHVSPESILSSVSRAMKCLSLNNPFLRGMSSDGLIFPYALAFRDSEVSPTSLMSLPLADLNHSLHLQCILFPQSCIPPLALRTTLQPNG